MMGERMASGRPPRRPRRPGPAPAMATSASSATVIGPRESGRRPASTGTSPQAVIRRQCRAVRTPPSTTRAGAEARLDETPMLALITLAIARERQERPRRLERPEHKPERLLVLLRGVGKLVPQPLQ